MIVNQSLVCFMPLQGGTLVNYDGKIRLLELAQVPKDKVKYLLVVMCTCSDHTHRLMSSNLYQSSSEC